MPKRSLHPDAGATLPLLPDIALNLIVPKVEPFESHSQKPFATSLKPSHSALAEFDCYRKLWFLAQGSLEWKLDVTRSWVGRRKKKAPQGTASNTFLKAWEAKLLNLPVLMGSPGKQKGL